MTEIPNVNYGTLATGDAHIIQVSGGSYIAGNATFINQVPLTRRWETPREFARTIQLDRVVARERELTWLSKTLLTEATGQRVYSLLTGFPGVGKTTLAALFMERHRHLFTRGTLWADLGAEIQTPEQVQPILDRWASYGFGGNLKQGDQEKHYRFDPLSVRELLTGEGRILCVFDDVWHVAPVETLIKALPGDACVLITSTKQDLNWEWGNPPTHMVGPLLYSEAKTLLQRQISDLPDEAIDHLVNRAEFQAHELQVAAAQIRATNPADRLKRLQEIIVLAQTGSASDAAKAVIESTYNEIKQVSEPAGRWLRELAILGRVGIDFSSQMAAVVWQISFEKAEKFLNTLKNRSFIQRTTEDHQDARWLVPATLRNYAASLLTDAEFQTAYGLYINYVVTLAFELFGSATPPRDALAELAHIHYVLALCLSDLQERVEREGENAQSESVVSDTLLLLGEAVSYARVAPDFGDAVIAWLPTLAEMASKLPDYTENGLKFWFTLGVLRRDRAVRQDEFDAALDAFSRAEQLAQTRREEVIQAWSLIAMGHVYAYSNRESVALERFERASQVSSDPAVKIAALNALGDVNVRITNFETAQRHYDHALYLAQQHQFPHAELEIFADLGELCSKTYRWEDAVNYFKDAQRIARQLSDDPLAEAGILQRLGQAYREMNRSREALTAFEQAHRIIAPSSLANTVTEAYLIADEGMAHAQLQNYDRAIELLQHASAFGQQTNNQHMYAQMQNAIANVERSRGQLEPSIPLNQAALRVFETLRDPRGIGDAHAGLAETYMRLGQMRDALTHCREAWQYLMEAQNRKAVVYIIGTLGQLFQSLNELESGVEFMQTAAEVTHTKGYLAARLVADSWHAILLAQQGQVELAFDLFNNMPKSLDDAQIEYLDERVIANSALGLSHALLGHEEEARRFFDDGLHLVKQTNDIASEAQILLSLAQTYENLKRYGEAERYIARALPIMQQLGDRPRQAALYVVQCGYLGEQGKFEETLSAAEKALRLLEKSDSWELIWRTYTNIAVAHWHLKLYDEALEALDQAETTAQKGNLIESAADAILRRGFLLFIGKRQYEAGIAEIERAARLLEQSPVQDKMLGEMPQLLRLIMEALSSAVSDDALRDLLIHFLRVTSWEAAQYILQADESGLLLSDRAQRTLDSFTTSLTGGRNAARQALRLYHRILRECRSVGVEEGLRRAAQRTDTAPIYYWWGAQHRAKREYITALTNLNRAIQQRDNEPEYLLERGWIYRGLGTYKLALEDFRRAVELNYSGEELYMARGVVYYEIQQYQDALNDFNQAIERGDSSAYALQWRAAALTALNQPTLLLSARADLDRAIQIDSHESAHRYWSALLYLQMNQFEQALEDLDHAIRLDNDRPADLTFDQFWAGVTCQQLRQHEQSAHYWREAETTMETITNVSERCVRGVLLALIQGRVTAAEGAYHDALRANVPRQARHTLMRHLDLLALLYPDNSSFPHMKQLIR